MRKRLMMAALLSAALCAGPAAEAVSFPDIPEEHWAAADVALCVEQGYFDGVDGEDFLPQNPLRRDVFMEVLRRFFHWEEADPDLLPYSDVLPSEWYAGAAAAAYEHGVLVSMAETFRPEDTVTREELASMLLRALGYRSISGLAETLPFSDVTANTGYIAMAYEMGLMNGKNGQFLPGNDATKVQTAAVLARLHRRLYSGTAERIAAVSGDISPAARLDTALVTTAEERNAVREAGAWPILNGGVFTGEIAAVDLAESVGGCEGLFLDVTGGMDPDFAGELKTALNGKLLYLLVPDPRTAEDFPYIALSESADVLAVQVAPGEARVIEGFPSDPVDPLEEVYDILQTLRRRLDTSKAALVLTTSGRLWSNGTASGTISGKAVAALLSRPDTQSHFSERYSCAYLHCVEGDTEQVVWYLDRQAVVERLRLARLFGVRRVFLTDAAGAAESLWSGLNG